MLLTITYNGVDTENLGFLLHKNPYRAQSFELSFGNAYVFYPEVSNERTTAALLLDINPIDLARGKVGADVGGLFDYVNDRPYVASSFMSTALNRVFGTAMLGRCDRHPELANTPIDLTARIYTLPYRGDLTFLNAVFEPLGYAVSFERKILDEKFPEWGDSAYIDLTIRGQVKLCDLLNHLYVLIPVFDKQKHYYVSEDEIEKLLRHGAGWLESHPARNRIVGRYFDLRKSYAKKAIDRLTEAESMEETIGEDSEMPVSAPKEPIEKRASLNTKRLEAVKNALIASGAKSVIDLGCGEGKLLAMLLNEPQFTKLTGADVSISALERSKRTLHYDDLSETKRSRLHLMQASLTYQDVRFSGYDAAAIVEVIEHLDPMRLPALERIVFEVAAPSTVVLTTPNKDYNIHYENLPKDGLRHTDHRFEWTRSEFAQWCEHICDSFGYTVEIQDIGDKDESDITPTQMGVFTKCV